MDIEVLKKALVYSLPGMESVAVTRDLAFDDDPVLRLDLYRPPQAAVALPAVFFIHGGPLPAELGFRPKEWGVYQSYGRLAGASGLAGVTFNHRLFGREAHATAASDVEAAIGYVRANGPELGIDAERLAVWAFSGGGPQLAPLIEARPAYLRCLVAFYAALDLESIQRPDLPPLDAAMLRRMSPLAQLKAAQGLPAPMLVARAGRDSLPLNQTIDAFVQAAVALNAPIELMNHPDGQHGFDIADDVPRSRDIIARTLAFVRAQLA